MAKRWCIHAHDPERIAALGRATGLSAVVAQLLVCRGTTDPEAARIFLDPRLSALRDPELLPGCCDAARQIHAAIAGGRRIVVYGDYDVDGMSAAAILYGCLKLAGANVGTYLPNRIEEGYGLNCDAIRALSEQGTQMLVTVDCGIASVAEVALARSLGMEVIVSDHHEPGAELPEVGAMVHPRVPAGAYPFGGLSGAGVAFKLAWAVCQQCSGAKRVSPRMRDFLVQAVGLAALGTVADVVPLLDENRILVRHGLTSLAEHPTPGLEALLEVTDLKRKRQLSSDDIAFCLAPRLNAAGRLGQPGLALELLLTDRPERAMELAKYLHQLNDSRQTLERSILLAAGKQIKEQFDPEDNPALVLADRAWHPGIIGIVAGKLAEKHHRPVVLVALDPMRVKPGTGSARSVPGFNLHDALSQCSEWLVAHGGHAAAAGLRIEEDRLDGFRAAFCEVVAEGIAPDQREAELWIDAESTFSALTVDAVNQMQRLAPFGEGNRPPLLCASEVRLAEPPKPMGNGGHHLQVRLMQHGVTIRGVCFGGGEWCDALTRIDRPIDVAFRPVINDFRGQRKVELHLVDWR
ncbi:MAG: single-stranded-DNA-specific exonuclease RecJ [Planctomycetota bacterium]